VTAPDPAVELVLAARNATIAGGLGVRRALPQARRRMVGPFVFVDQMGPASLPEEHETAVLPHPHIGLSTITYLFEGEGLHRDSLGCVQRILPGEVNWMTAGRGIVHSERLRPGPSGRMFGVQIWVALPRHMEEVEPSFQHYGADAVPVLEGDRVVTRVIAGALLGARSKVQTSSPLFYAEARMEAGAALELRPEYEERAVYLLRGAVTVAETALAPGELAVLQPGADVQVRASEPAMVLLLGGEPLDGPRHISWNFVSSSEERLQEAARDWRAQRFPRVPGETRYLPLPEDGDEPVNYP